MIIFSSSHFADTGGEVPEVPPKRITELNNGDLVKDDTSTYYDAPIVWKIADKEHPGYPSGSITLISDKILCLKGMDDAEPTNPDATRRGEGSNYYRYSNIRQWLNKSGYSWYVAQYEYDAPPTTEFCSYESESGFLTNLSSNFLSKVLDTTYTIARMDLDGGGTEELTDKFFLPSTAELFLKSDSATCGTKFPIFTSDPLSLGAYPTAECISRDTKPNYSPQPLTSSFWPYFTRQIEPSRTSNFYTVYSNANYPTPFRNVDNGYDGSNGIRPICNISNDVMVSGEPDENGIYSIVWDSGQGEITGNPFSSSFNSIDDITLTKGNWNTGLDRIEC